jgi:drug/metabolite transporter (DMT)-like permease
VAVLLALLVTFLWSTSWVLIKIGLKASLPAITFAGLRYGLAFCCLLPWVVYKPENRHILRGLSHRAWAQLILLGVLFYALTQGAQFLSLAFLPAATVTLLLSLSPLAVAMFGGISGSERLTAIQWGGVILSVVGVLVYFLPLEQSAGQGFGLLVAVLGVIANAASSLLGRRVNRQSGLPPIIVTVVSMGVGAALLLAAGFVFQGLGHIDPTQWLIIAWLAVVNTALAFTLWNLTLQTLTAVESSVLNNTMLPQIAVLAWLFLGESLSPRRLLGMILVGFGALIVQVWRSKVTGRAMRDQSQRATLRAMDPGKS